MKEDSKEEIPKERSSKTKQWLWWVAGIVGLLIAIWALVFGYMYFSSPAAIRQPQLEHAHFRLQVVVDGTAVNFADSKFQVEYDKNSCSQDIPMRPVHFHDGKDQFVHLHWKDMTGGLLLKYYGWNMVGGPVNALGFRFDQLPKVTEVPIYGNVLPAFPDGAKLWVYTGDSKKYTTRSADDFLKQNIEDFLGTKSTVNPDKQAFWSHLFAARASAHGGEVHGPAATTSDKPSQAELARINNLLGNVVIFVQNDEPTSQQIKDRFNDLEPLSESTCGG